MWLSLMWLSHGRRWRQLHDECRLQTCTRFAVTVIVAVDSCGAVRCANGARTLGSTNVLGVEVDFDA